MSRRHGWLREDHEQIVRDDGEQKKEEDTQRQQVLGAAAADPRNRAVDFDGGFFLVLSPAAVGRRHRLGHWQRMHGDAFFQDKIRGRQHRHFPRGDFVHVHSHPARDGQRYVHEKTLIAVRRDLHFPFQAFPGRAGTFGTFSGMWAVRPSR